MWDLGPLFVFVVLWLPWCSAHRPSIGEDHFGSVLDLEAGGGCPEELLEKQRRQLHGFGWQGDGNPCEWKDVKCDGCKVVGLGTMGRSVAWGGGDLAYLQDMTDLEDLWLDKTKVFGDVKHLRRLTKLHYLYVAETQVSGDLEAFENLTDLRGLLLTGTQVTGDIRSLRSLTRLELLEMDETKVSGDVGHLQSLYSLDFMDLSGSQVSGDVKAFRGFTDVERIILRGTQVHGDIGGLTNLRHLSVADFRQTRVFGDVASLHHLSRLKRLFLSQTEVSGDIAAFENLTLLRELELAQTQVWGDLAMVSTTPALARLDMSATKVSGSLASLKFGCCKNLLYFNVTDTQFTIPRHREPMKVLQALQVFSVSGCLLKCTAEQLVFTLSGIPITSLFAARCGLTGSVPRLGDETPLGRSLQLVDLSGNNLKEATFLPVGYRLDISRNQQPLRLSPAVVAKAAETRVELWLTNTTLANPEDMRFLSSTYLQSANSWVSRESGRYACQELVAANVHVTQELFMPLQLCGCMPGFFGRGTNCVECPENTFNDAMNQSSCRSCPSGSNSSAGASSLNACACRFGFPGKMASGHYVCRCEKNEAETSDQHCVPCGELHLLCPGPGEVVATARLQPGFIRLQEPSEEIFQCLDPKRCRNSSCAPGYVGTLCADCAANFRTGRRGCMECREKSFQQKLFTALGCLAALATLLAVAWYGRHYMDGASHRQRCLLQLLVEELTVLLHLIQLWTVLGGLPRAARGGESLGDRLLSYLKALQLTSGEVQNLLALQCVYDGVTVRTLFALATPVIPLLLLLLCGFLEVFSRGLGIRIGLKILRVLFIGGAAGSVQLLDCQTTDGAGASLKEFAFRPLLPHQFCNQATWVDMVGWITAACYGLLIPVFLGFLFTKQNAAMRKTKIVITQATQAKGKVTVRLQGLNGEQTFEEAMLAKLLTAAAAAYVANCAANCAATGAAFRVELQGDAVVVAVGDAAPKPGGEESFIQVDKETQMLHRHATAQMLLERSVLEEETDRVMMGAKQLLQKYAKCENVWMEVCTKVAAAALIAVVSMDGLWVSVGITLGMSLITSFARPFAHPQVNDLQATGFACLAVAAVGFRYSVLLANAALVVPFLLLMLQLRRPDSVEMLALRLQQELELKIHEGPVEVNAEQFA